MTKDFSTDPYILDSSSKKWRCPSCGKKTFTPYVNRRGEILDNSCGICDRTNNCKYHYHWRDFFKDNPEKATEDFKEWRERNKEEWKRSNVHSVSYTSTPKPQPPTPISYISDKYIQPDKNRANNGLYRGLINKYPEMILQIDEAFDKYRIMTSKHWRVDGCKATAFPQIDTEGRCRQIKVIAYHPDTAKRLKKDEAAEFWSDGLGGYVSADTDQDKSWYAGKSLMGKDKHFQQTLFGAHLVKDSNKPLVIVEGEKGAIVGSIFLDCYVWLATGGKGQVKLDSDEIQTMLRGKKVYLFPDRDAVGDWRKLYNGMKAVGIDVEFWGVEYTDDMPDNADIVDWIDCTIAKTLQQTDTEPQPDVIPYFKTIKTSYGEWNFERDCFQFYQPNTDGEIYCPF